MNKKKLNELEDPNRTMTDEEQSFYEMVKKTNDEFRQLSEERKARLEKMKQEWLAKHGQK